MSYTKNCWSPGPPGTGGTATPRPLPRSIRTRVYPWSLKKKYFLVKFETKPLCFKVKVKACFSALSLHRIGWIQPFLSNRPRQNSYRAARNSMNFSPQTDATTFAFASLSILLLCQGVMWNDQAVGELKGYISIE